MSSPAPASKRPRRPGRLSTRLLLIFLLLALVPTVILTVVGAISRLQNERDIRVGTLQQQASIRAKLLEDWAANTEGTLRDILNDPQVRPAVTTITTTSTPTAVQTFTEHTQLIIQSGSIYNRLVLLDPQGRTLSSNDPSLIGHDFSAEPWFIAASKEPTTITVTGPAADPLDQQESYYFAVAFRNSAGAPPAGVLMGRVSTGQLQAVMAVVPSFGETGEFFLVRQGQEYVISPSKERSMVASDGIVGHLLQGNSGSGDWIDYRGVSVTGVYRWIPELNLGLVVKEDASEVGGNFFQTIQLQVAIGAAIILLAIIAAVIVTRLVTLPVERLGEVASRISLGDTNLRAPAADTLEFSLLADSFNRMTAKLTSVLDQQEELIKSRTRQLELTAQIGRVIAAETDPERLLRLTINMVREQLGYYHVQIFMLDDLHQFAVLRASTGAVGQQLLARGHKLAVGSQSVIGQVTTRGEPIVVLDTDSSPVHRRNELLPDTRAELAVALRIGDEIIGALDVQSVHVDAFDEATIASFRTIADQLAVAIRNAQLFEEKEGLLSASLQLTQTLTRDNWEAYLSQRGREEGIQGFKYDLSGIQPLDEKEGDGGNGHSLNVPIALRGEIIGEMGALLPEGTNLSEEQMQLVGQVLDRVALALENARLFEQTQVSLAEANRLYQASQQIAAADSVDGLVETTLKLIKSDNIDRAAVLLLEESTDVEAGRWLDIRGRWLREGDDAANLLAQRMPFEQFKLLAGIEKEVPPGGLAINDLSKFVFDKSTTEALDAFGIKALAYYPLITGGRTLGWLMLNNTHRTDVFNETDTRFYSAIADQAATALEGLRLYDQAQTRLRRVQATNEVSRAASSILNPDILLPLTVDKISEAFDYYHAQIFLVDDQGENAILRASTGEVGQELLRRQHKLPVGSQSVIGQVTARGEPVIARDTDVDHVHQRNELLPNTRAEMAIPLKTGDRVIGALDVQSTQVNAFDTEARAILQSLADQISVTLENAQLFQEIQDRVAELTTVNLISQAVSRAETLEDLYDVVAVQLQRTFGVEHAMLAVVAPNDMIEIPIFLEAGQLQPAIQPIPMGQGLTSHVLKTREVLLINEKLEEQAAQLGARVIGIMPKSLLAVPLLLGDEIIGVISIQDAEKEHAYNETHVRQLTTLAAYIAIKIRNAELLEEAQRRASELGFLFNVTRAAVSAAHIDDALSNVAAILRDEIAGAEAALIYLVNPDEDALEPHAAIGYGRDLAARYPQLPMDMGMMRMVARDGVPMVVDDLQQNPNPFDERSRAGVLVPLKSGLQVIGTLMIMSTQAGIFKERDLRLLEAASGTLTAIIQNARLLDQITKANEQLRELDKLKSQFLANMSHELRTPLNSIIGFSRVMLKGIDGPLSDLQTQDLTTIYNSGQHLLGLINDILDLSKIEAGKMEVQPEYIGLNEIIDGVMASGKGLIKDKPIQIFKEVEPNLPQVYGDPVRVRQVLLNLVSNASKFTSEGSITIRAGFKPGNQEAGEPDRVQLDVQDTGIGIAQKDMDKLFEAFRQVDGSTTRQVGGTGLGLAISKQFVEMHGGRMWITSEVGKGSTFSFTIPLHPPALEPTQQVIHTGQDGGGRPLVVAVDDELGVLELYGRYLDKSGYELVGLNNANDLLRHVRELHPSALLLDLNLPGKDGWAALQDLRQSDDLKNLPVIICSIEDQRERASKAGASGYLIKPIVEDDLIRVVGDAIAAAPGRTLTALIADADAARLKALRDILEAAGHTVHVTSTGVDALQSIMEGKIDVLFLDLDLPDMDGYGLLMSARSQGVTQNLPVILVGDRTISDEDMARVGADFTRVLAGDDLKREKLLPLLDDLTKSAH